jgi:potassium voltage-gated channel Eag-related subfamily H protein 8
MCTIINKSLKTDDVPRSMKIAKVIPIHKSKDKTDLGNYRPISLLSSLSKILEKIVLERLYSCFMQTRYNV